MSVSYSLQLSVDESFGINLDKSGTYVYTFLNRAKHACLVTLTSRGGVYRLRETEQQRRDREHQEDLAKLRGLRPIDDDFMRCIFRDNKPLAELVLRIITGKTDLIVKELETQADLKRLVGARSIMLDALVMDSEDKLYDMEVQRADRGADKHRARYHSSAMDVDNLKANQKFSDLPETYTIFITENDVYGDGKPFHRIERVDLDGDEKPLFNDGEHILYVNGAFRDESDFGKLMHDFNCWKPEDMNFALMREATRFYKENPKGVKIVCLAFEETRNERSIWIAKNLIETGKMALEEIATACGLPLDKVKELAETTLVGA